MAPATIELDELTLSTLSKGRLEKRFQECLGELGRKFGEAEDLEQDAAGNITGSIKMDVTLVYSPQTGAISVVADAQVKLPKYVKSGGAAHYGTDGKFYSVRDSRDMEQPPLFNSQKVTPMTRKGGEG